MDNWFRVYYLGPNRFNHLDWDKGCHKAAEVSMIAFRLVQIQLLFCRRALEALNPEAETKVPKHLNLTISP